MDLNTITCREECGNIGFTGDRKWATFSSQSWAGARQSEWARGSRTPSAHSPGETARYTWGRSSSGSPRAPRTCSDRSWVGRWPRRADSASCPCCKDTSRRWRRQRTLTKSICLVLSGRPSPDCCQLECDAESALNTCYNTRQEQQQHTWAAFKRLSITWDQSRRRPDLRSQRRCGSLLPGALCWEYPRTETEYSVKESSQVHHYTCEPYVVVLLLLWILVVLWAAEVACWLDANHIAVPGGWTHRGESQQLVIWELLVFFICRSTISDTLLKSDFSNKYAFGFWIRRLAFWV